MRKLLRDKRNLVLLLFVGLILIKSQQVPTRFFLWLAAGALLAALFDFLINKFFLKKLIFPKSALISGCIVAGILDYHQPWFVIVVFSTLAILAKHTIKFRKRHILNPANFALFVAAILKIPLTWNIESNILLIIIAGLYLAYSLKKIPHILGFLVFFSGLFALQGINPFNLVSWFFVFIMLIEPKTSGFGLVRGFVFGSIVGIAAFLVSQYLPYYDLFVSSLFIANLCNPLLGRIRLG